MDLIKRTLEFLGRIKFLAREQYHWRRTENVKADIQPIERVERLILENPNATNIEEMTPVTCLSFNHHRNTLIRLIGIISIASGRI